MDSSVLTSTCDTSQEELIGVFAELNADTTQASDLSVRTDTDIKDTDNGADKSKHTLLPNLPPDVLKEQQKKRTFLRKRFLSLLNNISSVPVEFMLVNGKQAKAGFGHSDVDVLHLQVNNLQTPLGKIPVALLRTSDIISYKFTLPA